MTREHAAEIAERRGDAVTVVGIGCGMKTAAKTGTMRTSSSRRAGIVADDVVGPSLSQ